MRISTPVEKNLEMLFSFGAVGGMTDAELLTRFVRREDAASSDAAFAALVERHGPMVLGVCRRMLGDDHAADDAFQAVFLVLAAEAPTVRVDDTLGRWLHGVSVRLSRRARAVARRERERVRALDGLDPPDPSGTAAAEEGRELREAIDEEIARLPVRYRSAVVVCDLEGLTQEQAARRLRCPVGTVQSRLHRARERLRPALARRGLAPQDWGPSTTRRAEVSPSLAALAGKVVVASAGDVPATVALLAQLTLRSILMSRILRVGLLLMAMAATATSAGILAGDGDEPAARSVAARGPVAKSERPGPVPAADGRLEIRAVAAATGRPIAEASVVWRLRINQGKYKETKNSTDGDGRAVLEWPAGAAVNGLEVTVRKPGFVPYSFNRDDRSRPLQLPSVKELRLVPGIPIGGLVKDESGTPVAGAKITVNAPPSDSDRTGYNFPIAETTTDADGRWRFDDAPPDLVAVSFHVQASGFLRAGGQPIRNLDSVTVVGRGFTIRGRVLDTPGKPIAGASVQAGAEWDSDSSRATTDPTGAFVLENCKPGASIVVVQAEGFAPIYGRFTPRIGPRSRSDSGCRTRSAAR